MSGAELVMGWQTLAELAKDCAALPKEAFGARFETPFLLELNPEGEVATGETRGFDPQTALQDAPSPSLSGSLIVNLGGREEIVLGRGDAADIRCQHETVSERHCALEKIAALWAIKDLGSKNGTFVNGQQLAPDKPSPLKFGSKITLGEAQFLYLGVEDCFDLLQELIKEPRIRPRSMGKYRADFKAADSMDEIRQKFPGPFLVVQAPTGRDAATGPVSSNTITLSAEELKKHVNKNVADAVFNLEAHHLVRVGRATVTQIHLPLGPVSNLHAALVRDGDDWYVQDLGAKNGTYVWGERLEGKKKLESGSEIVLGNIKTIFFSTDDLVTYAAHRDTLV